MENDNILSPNILNKVFTVENSKIQVIPKGLVNISIPIRSQESNPEHLSSI